VIINYYIVVSLSLNQYLSGAYLRGARGDKPPQVARIAPPTNFDYNKKCKYILQILTSITIPIVTDTIIFQLKIIK
jgi:hypothetical protein